MNRTSHSHPMRYNLQQIETCIAQCSQRCSNKASLRDVIARSLRGSSWSQALKGSFQKGFLVAAKLLMQMIYIVQVCPCGMCDETLRSNIWNIFKGGLSDKAHLDRLTSLYDPHPTNGTDNSAWNDKTLLTQLMLLADSGFYFHLSRLVNTLEEYQYMQVLFVLNFDRDFINLKFGRDDDHTVRTLPKLLGLPNLASYLDIKESVDALYEPSYKFVTFKSFFRAFQRDPARSGGFHHDPASWHAFTATHFLRFLTAVPLR